MSHLRNSCDNNKASVCNRERKGKRLFDPRTGEGAKSNER